MDILKTPHEKLLEEAGAMPYSDGYLKTPKQILFQEAGALPKLAEGGDVFSKNPDDMRAEIMAQDVAPQQEEVLEEEETPMPELKNPALFNTIKEVVNNPGHFPKEHFSPQVAQLLEHFFGPNIFSK